MAFARLFSQRRVELDLSVVDIAVRTGRPIEVVVAWDRGSTVPDAQEITKVAEVLRLPKPLLKEAIRRVNEYRQGTAPLGKPEAGSPPGGEPGVEEPSASTATGSHTPPRTRTGRGRDFLIVAWSAVGNVLSELRYSILRRRRIARAPVDQPSYVEDQQQMVAYRLRAVFTVAGVIVLALILRWSFTGLGSAIADLLDSLTGAL